MTPPNNDDSPNHTLPQNFQFSQGSLQAYVNCPRLFQLRYIKRLSWPAPEAEPALDNERYMQMGSDFHRLIQQVLLGIPETRLEKAADKNDMLSRWLNNFLNEGPSLEGYKKFKEITLSASVDDNRLVAKYDLIAIPDSHNEKVYIFDWKTSRKLPKKGWQAKKLQTRVYPLLLVEAGNDLNGGARIEPDRIEMIYWFSNFPTAPIKYSCSDEQFQIDKNDISHLIIEIKNIGVEDAPKTENEKLCKFCVYRSLCNRGVTAGTVEELEIDFDEQDEFDFNLDFEQIAEIEF